jgi:uncharacterized protein YuzE
MKIQYYQEADSLYIELSPKVSVDSNEVSPGVVLNVDSEGIWWVSTLNTPARMLTT